MAGKKFQRQWVFRNLKLEVNGPEKIAITGSNGSGKSTLLQIISGFQSLSEGTIQFSKNSVSIPAEQWYNQVAYASPYLDLPEEYNIEELLSFYAVFKPFLKDLNHHQIIEIIQLSSGNNKAIKFFSSGMKQRLKLGIAILSDVPVILLDEPLSNLDKEGHIWYQQILSQYSQNKTVIICSNHVEDEIIFCERKININDFKV